MDIIVAMLVGFVFSAISSVIYLAWGVPGQLVFLAAIIGVGVAVYVVNKRKGDA